MAKKKWTVRLPVERASGHQYYEVMADSLEEAKQAWAADQGNLECVSEEIEVEHVGEPEFLED